VPVCLDDMLPTNARSTLIRSTLKIARYPSDLPAIRSEKENGAKMALFYYQVPKEHAIAILGFVSVTTVQELTARYISQFRSVDEELPPTPRKWLYRSTQRTPPLIISGNFNDLAAHGVPRILSTELFEQVFRRKPFLKRVGELLESNQPTDRFAFYALIQVCSRDRELRGKVEAVLARWADYYFRRRGRHHTLEYDMNFFSSSTPWLERVRMNTLETVQQEYIAQKFYEAYPKEPLPKTLRRCKWTKVLSLVRERKVPLIKGYAYLCARDAHLWFPSVLLSHLIERFNQLDEQHSLANGVYPECNWVPGCDPTKVRAIVYRDVPFTKLNRNFEEEEDKSTTEHFSKVFVDREGELVESDWSHERLSDKDRISVMVAYYYRLWEQKKEHVRTQTELARIARAKASDPHIKAAIRVYQKAGEDGHPPRVAFMRAFGNALPPCIAQPIHRVIQAGQHLRYPQRSTVFPFLCHAGVPLEITESMWRDIYSHSSHRGDRIKQKQLDSIPAQAYKRQAPKQYFFSCATVIDKAGMDCCPFSEKDEGVADIEDMVEARQLLCKATTNYPGQRYLSPSSLFRHQVAIVYEQK